MIESQLTSPIGQRISLSGHFDMPVTLEEGRAKIVAVQPRIRLMRSFDERHHSYQGYVLRVDGTCGDERGDLLKHSDPAVKAIAEKLPKGTGGQ